MEAGTRLGPYEVVSRLGAGGMGEVYRARDTRLDRHVALKVLPEKIAARDDVRQRFEREARAISALNHPNICTLFDVGSEGSVAYLVMELLDGETLAEVIARGPLPLDRALRYAIDIATALDRAHQLGIVHRDLKPGNIMITKSGLKLLDFGLARLEAVAGHNHEAPTVVNPITTEGMMLGTLQYMSPEQLEGKTTDARADIFAFGCILYEMVTGRRTFDGSSTASIISAIMTTEPPPLAEVVPVSPPALDRLIRKCLRKSAEERWHCAGDLATELTWIADGSPAAAAAAGAKVPRARLAWVVATIALVGAIVATALLLRKREVPPMMRLTLALDSGMTYSGDWMQGRMSLSPDGRSIAFAAAKDGKSMIWVRPLDSPAAKPIPNTDGVQCGPIWSPDSRYLAFVTGRKLVRVAVDGSEMTTICDVANIFATYTWSHDGTIVFAEMEERRSLFRVPATGGQPQPVKLPPDVTGKRVVFPQFIGDSTNLTYCTIDKGADLRLHLLSLDSGADRDLGPTDSRIRLAGSTILFVRDGSLFAQRTNRNLEKIGEPILIASDVHYAVMLGVAELSVTPDVIAYTSSVTDSKLTWYDRRGLITGTVGIAGVERGPHLSPDGRVAGIPVLDRRFGSLDLWLCDLEHDAMTRLTETKPSESTVVWSPDGKRIAYSGEADGPPHIFTMPATGGEETMITPPGSWQVLTDWSPDGKSLLLHEMGPKTRWDIMLVAPEPNAKPVPWLKTRFNEGGARFSPDGKWIVYTSDGSGKSEVYISPVSDSSMRTMVSRGGGTNPVWRRDGREIFYWSPVQELYAVPIHTGSSVEAGQAQLLFRAAPEEIWEGYDVDAKGEKFLINRARLGARNSPIHLIVNWQRLLEKK